MRRGTPDTGRAGAAGGRCSRLVLLWADQQGQAMTEYVIVTAMMVAAAAYLYHPDNLVFNGIRDLFDRTALLMKLPGP
jgi:hypothetical protein